MERKARKQGIKAFCINQKLNFPPSNKLQIGECSCKPGVPHVNNSEAKDRFESSQDGDDFNALIVFLRFTGIAHDDAAERW